MNRLLCPACGTEYPLDVPRWRCDCRSALDIELDYTLDVDTIAARNPCLWRYREALPLADDRNIVSFGEGFTPLMEADIFGDDPSGFNICGAYELRIEDQEGDRLFFSGSFDGMCGTWQSAGGALIDFTQDSGTRCSQP